MSWKIYYFWTVLIVSILAFQCGRAFELDSIENKFIKDQQRLADAWLNNCGVKK